MDSSVTAAPHGPAEVDPPIELFHRRYLYLLTALTAIYGVVTLLQPTPWIDLPLGLLTLFFTPGYAIGAVTFGTRSRWPATLQFAIVVGWSVAWNVALGLALLVLARGLPPFVFAIVALGLIGGVALYWGRHHPESPPSSVSSRVPEALRLTGYTPGQRTAAYGLLAAIGLVFAIIIYLASVFPGNAGPGLGFSIVGPDGTAASLPTGGAPNVTLDIQVTIQNNATAQAFTLEVLTATAGSTPLAYESVPWGNPLVLGNATQSEKAVDLGSAASTVIAVPFQYPVPGHYVLSFLLDNSAGTMERNASWPVVIS
jgi:uncharacterized membrane protein